MDTVVVVRFVISLFVVTARVDAALLDVPCRTDTDCTVQYSECTGGKCSCGTGYYAYNNRYCSFRGLPGHSCNDRHNIQNQCVDGAVCQLPRTNQLGQHSNGPNMYYGYYSVCICQPGYYPTGRACEPRLALGGSCIYYGAFDKGVRDGQCPMHAACRTHVDVSGTLTYRCECADEYYVPNDGVCVKEIPLGGICSHNGENECVTPNAECYAKDGKSTCQCSDAYRQDGHSSCVSDDTTVGPLPSTTVSGDTTAEPLPSQPGTGYNPCVQGVPDCGGPYAYPGHPNMFIQCGPACTTTYERTCPATLVWNNSIKGCDYPS